MSGWLQDLRYGARVLIRSPGVSAAVIICLALGIGVNTAVFSVVDGVLLRPLAFPNADRLVCLYETNPEVSGFRVASVANVQDWAQQSQAIEEFGLGREWPFILNRPGGAEGVNGGLAMPGLFSVLGIDPLYGRVLTPEDLDPGSDRVVVLSHKLWRDRLGGSPNIVGQTLVLDATPYVVVGVLPAGLSIPRLEAVQLWTPPQYEPREAQWRSWRGFYAYGRLAPGASLERARTEMTTIAARLAQQYPNTNEGWGVRVESLHEQIVGTVRPAMAVFTGAAGLVLLIGCANVTNVLLVRATGRRRELAVRAAVGAGRFRLARLVLAENVVLSLLGGLAGALTASWVVGMVAKAAPGNIPRLGGVSVDGRALLFALAVSLLASVLSGLVPAIQSCRAAPFQALKGDRQGGGSASSWAGGGLIVSEVALTLMLLVGAGLLTRSFTSLMGWGTGFDRENIATVWLQASSGKHKTGWEATDLFARAAEEAQSLPGVISAGLGSAGPLFGGRETGEFTIVGRPDPSIDRPQVANTCDVSPTFLRTLGIPLLCGRHFTQDDVRDTPRVAIINETMARQYWLDQDSIGQQITIGRGPHTIVGVAADVAPLRPGAPAEPMVYWPAKQNPRGATYLVIRTSSDPRQLERLLCERLHGLDPDMPVSAMRTLEEYLGRQAAAPRFRMLLMDIFALVALGLAAVGIYGTLSYSVSQRTREIGVRVALGASGWSVLRTTVGWCMIPVLIGTAAGLAGAFALSRVLTGLLYGVEPTDLKTFAFVPFVLLAVALLASCVPARRAARVDPLVALRCE
ncbi:MAG: ABC transporter permease [Phycisphaerae bacterium]|jgi:putative ABC transport system permease protein